MTPASRTTPSPSDPSSCGSKYPLPCVLQGGGILPPSLLRRCDDAVNSDVLRDDLAARERHVLGAVAAKAGAWRDERHDAPADRRRVSLAGARVGDRPY